MEVRSDTPTCAKRSNSRTLTRLLEKKYTKTKKNGWKTQSHQTIKHLNKVLPPHRAIFRNVSFSNLFFHALFTLFPIFFGYARKLSIFTVVANSDGFVLAPGRRVRLYLTFDNRRINSVLINSRKMKKSAVGDSACRLRRCLPPHIGGANFPTR